MVTATLEELFVGLLLPKIRVAEIEVVPRQQQRPHHRLVAKRALNEVPRDDVILLDILDGKQQRIGDLPRMVEERN